MPLFSANSFLGVDIGTASVKVVELEPGKTGPRLLTYGLIELASNIVRDSSSGMQTAVASAIKSICIQAKVQAKKVVASLPGFSVFTSLINLPKMNDRELAQAIKYEAKRYVPISLDNMVLDWKVVHYKEVSTKEGLGTSNMQVLLTAAPKVLVNRYVALFRETGLRLVGLETEAFALTRALAGHDRSPILILDVGASATDIIVVAGGFPILNRTVELGGKILTETIAQSLNVNLMRAEQFKRDLGVGATGQSLPPSILGVLNRLVSEIQNTLKLYYGKRERRITKVILTGGSSQLAGLAHYIEDEINIKVFIGNPWARIHYPEALSKILTEIGPNFAVAIGLAMRELEARS